MDQRTKIQSLQDFLIFKCCIYTNNQQGLLIIEAWIKFERPFFTENRKLMELKRSKVENLDKIHKKFI